MKIYELISCKYKYIFITFDMIIKVTEWNSCSVLLIYIIKNTIFFNLF